MKKFIPMLFLISILMLISCPNMIKKDKGIFAVISTNKGSIKCRLFYETYPVTSANFIGLAEGSIAFTDKDTGLKVKKPFYSGLKFYSLTEDVLIRTGCPLNSGTGGPGYRLIDENRSGSFFDDEGILAMENTGMPDTAGSRFFITLAPVENFNGRYTAFGRVISGMKILKKIGGSDVDKDHRPVEDIVINKIKIIRTGADAKKFDVKKAFAVNEETLKIKKLEGLKKLEAFLVKLNSPMDQMSVTNIGLKYKILKKGYGKKPSRGDRISAHYTGYLEDGAVFDSSRDRGRPFETTIGAGKVIAGWDEGLQDMQEGEKRLLVVPYYLAYGENGLPPVIPPRSDIVFIIDLIKVE